MTDSETLYAFRLKQAEETLAEAERMAAEGFSPRTITNRAYYAMFYAVLALFIKTNLTMTSSKHRGIISLFDKDFVKTGKIDKRYSKILHETFDARQVADYQELIELSQEDAGRAIEHAKAFLSALKQFSSTI